MSLSTPLRIGVIGAGRIGALHADNVAQRVPGAALAAIADPLLPAAQQVAARHHLPTAFADYHAILDDPAIDAVVICSPTDTHARLIEESAAAGKHIFCEKPIDFDLARIDHALAAAAQAGVALQIGFNRRFDAQMAKVRAVVAAGQIGAPHLLRITSRDPAPPPADYLRGSGGLFLDMAIHDFDMARFLLGEEPSEVSALGSVLVDPAIAGVPDIDSVAVTLRTPSGKLCQISNSRRAVYGYDQRIEVHGSAGMARAENMYESTAEVATADGYHRPPLMNFFLERYMPAYLAEVAAFVHAVTTGTPPSPTGIDGLRALVLADAAVESLRTGRSVAVDGLDPS